MTIQIRGREYILSERRAYDVLELTAVAQKKTDPDTTTNVVMMAQVLSDSLKATYQRLGRVRGFPYRQYTGKAGIRLLLESLSMSQLQAAVEMIAEVEGLKKKATTPAEANPSDGLSLVDSSPSSSAST